MSFNLKEVQKLVDNLTTEIPPVPPGAYLDPRYTAYLHKAAADLLPGVLDEIKKRTAELELIKQEMIKSKAFEIQRREGRGIPLKVMNEYRREAIEELKVEVPGISWE